MCLKCISFLAILLSVTNGANILGIVPHPSYSHQIAYTQLWKELSLRGHKVTVITTDPLRDPYLTNLTEIDVSWSYDSFKDITKMAEGLITMWNFHEVMYNKMRNVIKSQLMYPPVQDLIHNTTRFDIVLVHFAYPEFLAFAEIYRCPKIVLSPLEISVYYHRAFGNPAHPVLNPDFQTPFYGSLTFKERIMSALNSWYMSYYYAYILIPERQDLIQNYFNITVNVGELMNDIDLMFVNVNPIIHGSRAIGPTTINIGGGRTSTTKKRLSKDLQEFLDGAKDGFIYFSLGTNVKSKDLNKKSIKSIVDSLKEMPYKVLWKFEADELPGKPDNVKLVKWAPQENVLSHPNIKLFITQGGLQSMEEAINSVVPMVVIPFYADQEKNSKFMAAKGMARIVGRTPHIRIGDLKRAMLDVVNNPRYKNSVEKLRKLLLDSPMTGLEKAIWWTEYVIRNKGARHLRNPAADLPLYQYYLIDVISFLLLSIFLILLVVIILIRILFKNIYKLFKHKNISIDKKLR